MAFRPVTWCGRSASRTCRRPPVWSAHRPACRVWTCSSASTRRAVCKRRKSSATSSSQSGADGQVTRLKDVARLELGAADYALRSLLNNKPAVAVPIFQAPGGNALAISDGVRATMAEIAKTMPEGVAYEIVYDPTQFVRASIKSVVTTLLEAVLLVVIVVIVFLQTWRASIIPLLAVPVSIVGTFAVMQAFGFSHQRAVAVRPGAGDRHRGR